MAVAVSPERGSFDFVSGGALRFAARELVELGIERLIPTWR